jgi:uncharacterized protein (DUF2141 family)
MKQFILTLLFVGLFQTQTYAQDTVTATVTDYWINGGNWNSDGATGGDPEMSLRYTFFRSITAFPFSVVFGSKLIEYNDPATNSWFLLAETFIPPSTIIPPKYTMVMPNKKQVKLFLEGWEDDCNPRDEFNTGCSINDDDDHKTWTLDSNNNFFNYANNPPETYFNYESNNCTGTECFKIRGAVKYSFPPISSPMRVGGSGILCPSQSLKLRTDFAAKKTGVKFQWQYDIKNASDTTLPIWKDILPPPTNYTNDSTIDLGVLVTRFPQLDTASRTKKLYTRVRAYTTLGGRVSGITVFDIFPKGPTAGQVTTQKACPAQSDGKILINNITTAYDTLRYIIKTGATRLNPCNPDTPAACFFNQFSSGFFPYPPNFTIENVPKGLYAVWILNGGGTTGSCYTIYDSVIVTEHPVLTFTLDSTKNVSCFNGSDGIVYLKRNNTAGPYVLDGLPSGANNLNLDSFIRIQALKAGTFSFRLKDKCAVFVGPVTGSLTQPPVVTMTNSFSNPDCKSPANGSITINAAGGSGSFSYYLSKNSVDIATSLNTTNTSMVVNDLSAGTYLLKVFDAQRPSCPPTTSTQVLTIAPDLSLSLKSIKNPNCIGSNEGRIEVSASGGYPSYKYRLTNIGTSAIVNSVDSFFSNLVAGTYKVQVFNNSASCSDFAEVTNIQVVNPSPITVSLSKENVKCSGNDNGKVTVTNVSGGTPNYQYKWWVKIGSTWSIFSSDFTMPEITNLYPALYRVEIIDANNCSKYSDSVDVREPNFLSIDSIVRTNPLCKGETGRLTVFAQGGTPPYSYLYSPSNVNNYNPLISGVTPLLARAYKVRLIDSLGCVITYPINQVISEANVALNFTTLLSDYNGRNIKCAGDTNGSIVVTATGGNGSSFSGYSYSLNSNPYSNSNSFTGLAAGTQIVKVKDGRGCEVSRSIVLTQADSLKAVIDSQVNIRCGLDSNGIIYTTSRGGVSPFTFSLNNARPYINGAFSNLKAGSYQVSLKDANGCENIISSTVSSLYSPIIENGLTTAVLCKGLSTGAIVTNISGGVQPYTYLWSSNKSTKDLAELKAGDYTLTVSDSINCNLVKRYTVSEPSLPLTNAGKVIPICEGKIVGGILPNTSGGTPSYTYSYDGVNFGGASSLLNIPLGSYTLSIKDANNCLYTEAFTVAPQTLNLKHDFLILTNGYKMDSLTLVDITSPKSDSNKWTFDSRMIILDSLGSHTNVVCPTVDTNYTVSMKSFFSTCEYSLTKTIKVLPIDTNYYKPNVKSGIDTFYLSPNPTTGIFTYYFKLSKIYQYGSIVINDINGKEVFVKSFRDIKESTEDIDVTSLSDGKYYVRLVISNDAKTVTLLIAK